MVIDEFADPELAREVDRLCDAFEHEWLGGCQPKIEAYLESVGRRRRASLLHQLLLIEWDLRAAGGEQANRGEFHRRFPDDGATVSAAWTEFSANQELDAGFPAQTEDPLTESVSEPFGVLERLGRYRLRRILGQGGCGRVYLAHDEELRRDVAIKVPSPELVARWGDIDSLVEEARTLAALDHPSIVPVYDVGRTDTCPCYVVSKFMEGPDLAQMIKLGRPSQEIAASLVAVIAEGLQVAHEKKIVHRDIKPANILLDSAGRPHLADFGLALNNEQYGKFQGIVGTPAYMSPEQVQQAGHLVDGRTDIYSLGVVFYELLTGERPFVAPNRRLLMERILTVEPRPPRQLDSAIASELEEICLTSLSKQPGQRYTSAADMARELRGWLQQNTHADTLRAAHTTAGYASLAEPLRMATADEVRGSDVVISCAKLDDQPLGPADEGWVSRFQNNLKVRMEQLLGESIQVASLPMSSSDPAMEDTIIDSVSAAKTFVSVVSPPFAKTPDCLRSVKEFWEANERSGDFCVQDMPRVFKVMKSPVPSEEIPADLSELFARLFGFEFYEQDPETGRIREFDEVFGPTLKLCEMIGVEPSELEPVIEAFRRPGVTFLMPTTDVTRDGFRPAVFAISPDGRRLAGGSENGRVRIWDTDNGAEIIEWDAHQDVEFEAFFAHDNRCMTYSSDASRLVTGGADGLVKVWDPATGKLERSMKGHARMIVGVRFTPDQRRIVSYSTDGTVRIWESDTGQELLTLKDPLFDGVWTWFLALPPDGSKMVAAPGLRKEIVTWKAASPEQVAQWQRVEAEDAELWTKAEQELSKRRAAPLAEQRRNEAALWRQQAELVAAQEKAAELRAHDPGAIKQWLVLGPIAFTEDSRAALDQEQLPSEAGLRPRADQQVVIDQGERTWTARTQEVYMIDLSMLVAKSVAYAVTYVQSDIDRTNLLLKVGSDDQAKIWLNGNEIYRSDVSRALVPDQDTIPDIELRAGLNVLVFKVVNDSGGSAGSVWITDASGNPVPGLTVTLDPDP